MKFEESLTLEFKRELTEGIKKEIIAFANTSGGDLYIGVDDDGSVVGLDNPKRILEDVSNIVHDSIQPDILMHTTLSIETIDVKDVVKISVSVGSRRPYHLKGKGLRPSGVFIRYGTSVTNASEENIRQMIIETDGTNFETMRSMEQDLTFTDAEAIFKKNGLSLLESNMRTLGIINAEGYYTNVGLLLSDQCEHTIKCARYVGVDKLEFQDRKEFTGSLLKQIESAFEYLSLHNEKNSAFKGLQRVEQESYPSYALREALINAATHRDYSFSSSTLIHIFTTRIELVSVGGLVKGLTQEDIELGISQSRNTKLANILYRLKWIESYGTGLQRILESYSKNSVQPFWSIGPNSFVVTLPKKDQTTRDEIDESLNNFLESKSSFTAKDLEIALNKSKSSVRKLLAELVNQNIINRIGNGPATRYKKSH